MYEDIEEFDQKNLDKGGKDGSVVIAENIYDWMFQNPYPITFLKELEWDEGYIDKSGSEIIIKVKGKRYKISVSEVKENDC